MTSISPINQSSGNESTNRIRISFDANDRVFPNVRSSGNDVTGSSEANVKLKLKHRRKCKRKDELHILGSQNPALSFGASY